MPFPDRTPNPGNPISTAEIAAVVGTSNQALDFLGSLILPEEKQPGVQMENFYDKTYVQRNDQGNCNNGNCNCNGNCGNVNCRNCIPGGTINCSNCQTQAWIQTNGTNAACTYQCNPTQTSYNCNCACNCSKIICAKLYELGLMNQNIWAADQAYGKYLRKADRVVYRGYVRWARIVTAWMDGKGPNYMPWILDEKTRLEKQKEKITDMAIKIGTPWSEHMAYLMGARSEDNRMGKILMTIGKPICRFVDKMPRKQKSQRHKLPTLWAMWALFYFSYYTSKTLTQVLDFVDTLKINKVKTLKES